MLNQSQYLQYYSIFRLPKPTSINDCEQVAQHTVDPPAAGPRNGVRWQRLQSEKHPRSQHEVHGEQPIHTFPLSAASPRADYCARAQHEVHRERPIHTFPPSPASLWAGCCAHALQRPSLSLRSGPKDCPGPLGSAAPPTSFSCCSGSPSTTGRLPPRGARRLRRCRCRCRPARRWRGPRTRRGWTLLKQSRSLTCCCCYY